MFELANQYVNQPTGQYKLLDNKVGALDFVINISSSGKEDCGELWIWRVLGNEKMELPCRPEGKMAK